MDLMCLLPTASVSCGLVLCGCVVYQSSREPLSLNYLVEEIGDNLSDKWVQVSLMW